MKSASFILEQLAEKADLIEKNSAVTGVTKDKYVTKVMFGKNGIAGIAIFSKSNIEDFMDAIDSGKDFKFTDEQKSSWTLKPNKDDSYTIAGTGDASGLKGVITSNMLSSMDEGSHQNTKVRTTYEGANSKKARLTIKEAERMIDRVLNIKDPSPGPKTPSDKVKLQEAKQMAKLCQEKLKDVMESKRPLKEASKKKIGGYSDDQMEIAVVSDGEETFLFLESDIDGGLTITLHDHYGDLVTADKKLGSDIKKAFESYFKAVDKVTAGDPR